MKKILLTILCLVILVITPLKANAFDWGSFFRWLWFGAEQTQVVSTDELKSTLSDLEKKAPELDAAVEKSFLTLIPLLTSQKDLKSISSEISKIKSSNLTTTEKEAKLLKLMSDYTTTSMIIITLKDSEKATLKNEITKLTESYEEYYKLNDKANSVTSKVASDADEEQIKLKTQINTLNKSVLNKAQTVRGFALQVKTLATLSGFTM